MQSFDSLDASLQKITHPRRMTKLFIALAFALCLVLMPALPQKVSARPSAGFTPPSTTAPLNPTTPTTPSPSPSPVPNPGNSGSSATSNPLDSVRPDPNARPDSKKFGEDDLITGKRKEGGGWERPAPDWYNWGASFPHFLFTTCRSLIDFCFSLCAQAFSLLDPKELFMQDLQGGTWNSFFDVAVVVSQKVAMPIGMAILGLSFVIQVASYVDVRRPRNNHEVISGILVLVLSLVITFTLMNNAVVILRAIYELAVFATRGVQKALVPLNFGANSSTLAESIKYAFDPGLDSITYGNFGQVFLYVLAAFVTFFAVLGCVIYVISTAFIRMVEIYLRLAFSAAPLAFIASDKTRPIATNWIKRFVAVVAQAVVIIVALALTPLLLQVSSVVTTQLISNASIDPGFFSVIPPIISVGCVTTMVKKSEQISHNLVGLM